MLHYMLLPGKIENNNGICDLKGISLMQLPIGAINDIYKVLSHHYIGRVYKFYVVNLSWSISVAMAPVKKMLTDRQRAKICILDSVNDLRKSFALHQLESDLGGTRPVITEFLPI